MPRFRQLARASREARGTTHLKALTVVVFCLSIGLAAPSIASAAPSGEITGTVTDAATHQPLEGIGVCADHLAGGGSCATTDRFGEYVIGGLEEGPYRVEFFSSFSARIYLTQFWSDKELESEAETVAITEGHTTSGIDAELQEGGRIAGTVTAGPADAPIEGIRVCALQPAGFGSPLECAETDAGGDYTITGLYGGDYKVEFSPNGLHCGCAAQRYRTQFYDDLDTWEEGIPVAVAVGATTGDIDARMVTTRTLTISLAGTGSGTVTSSPAGIDCGSQCSAGYGEGTAITLHATAAAGSHFAGWSGGGCSGSGPCSLTLDGNASVVATFEADGTSGGSGAGGGHQESAPPSTSSPVPGPTPGSPDTKITRVHIESGSRISKFAFDATGQADGFECKLEKPGDKGKFTPCSSPRIYRHLKPGRYVFSVRTHGAGGTDPTPAVRRFRIAIVR
jgi:hypothetical protein